MSDLRTRAAAAELDTTPETVRHLIKSGALKAYRLRGTAGPWRIRPEALDEYREAQTKRDPWARTRPRKRAA